MSGHATVETLSAYLDDELSATARGAVERHVASCPACRAELASLRRVVDRLRHLERAAPPQILAQHVQRRIALDGHRRGFLDRLEDGLRHGRRDMSTFSLFGVIIALLLFLYLFSVAVERAERGGSEMIIGTTEDWPAAEVTALVVGDRTFEWHAEGWTERGVTAAASASPTGDEATRELSWQEGVEGYPWIRRLSPPPGAPPGRILLRDGDIVVTIQPPAP